MVADSGVKRLQTDSQWVMRPTRWTLFFRTFLLWQLVRFVVVNVRMLIMLGKSHPHRLP